MAEETDAATQNGNVGQVDDRDHKRFCIAVENFIDLYKFVMVLAIGNCVRCLAARQIQPELANENGLELRLGTVSTIDTIMFVLSMLFISRFFLGDLAYWKSYTQQKNTQIQVSDALNLLINAFFLTYMSFFIGYTHLVAYMMFFLLATEVLWGFFRRIEGYFRDSEGPLSREINAGLVLSLGTLVFVGLAMALGELPAELPSGEAFSDRQNTIVVTILLINNILDLLINGGRYLGTNDEPLLLMLKRKGKRD